MVRSETRPTAGPTLEDVAREAGVSRATVSRVVNGSPTVAEHLQLAVMRAIATVGYVPNRAARQLMTGRSGVIALVTSIELDVDSQSLVRPHPQIYGDPFFGRIVDGVLGYLAPRRVHPLIMLAENALSRSAVLEQMRQHAVDGALVVSTDPADPLPAQLAEEELPAVFFAQPKPHLPFDYVDLAHQDGGRLVAERLIKLGRRRVAAISGPANLNASESRIDGFRNAMARHGVGYVAVAQGNFTQASGELAMRDLLLQEPDVDGVFAANDLMAVGALHVLAEQGRRVPEDVAVIGFDDSSAALAARPQLTTVRQPVEEMAARMARLLLERLDDPERRPQAELFDAELIVRSSA
ncbi:LacI family DNA-binding transcriptional regulator [Actinospica sp.]|uniref:LacI family DNA-binding transcriptional regulator n=1 Tax=Actinospica sp. TaxID=1872142 RepID=UPI002CE5606F|nr:LacI family DNA-binding transcriptional regulator [Actinospica sp.]HWG24284.1 LacI family DNA-binding transcriptional regulator [Actinospica sp.]